MVVNRSLRRRSNAPRSRNPFYQVPFGGFTRPVQAPVSPAGIVFLIWDFFYDKDIFLGFKFIKNLNKLQSGFFQNWIFPKKNRKFSRTFGIQAMSGTVRQEKVEPGTSGPQKVAQAYLRYYLSTETRPEAPG